MLGGDLKLYQTFQTPTANHMEINTNSALSGQVEAQENEPNTQTATDEQPTPSPSQRDPRMYARSPELGFIQNSIYAGHPAPMQPPSIQSQLQSNPSSHM